MLLLMLLVLQQEPYEKHTGINTVLDIAKASVFARTAH